MRKLIYADHAATTPLSPSARSAMEPFFMADFCNPSTKYSAARTPRKAVEQARKTIADCIGAQPSEIYFTSGGTESDNWAIKGTMLVRGDERCVITDAIEHHAVLNACAAVERMGFPAAYMMPDHDGVIQPATLESIISNTTKLVTVMTVNNELGSVQPIRELAEIAHRHGALFHTDAVQAVGHIPMDVNVLGVDMLSASAHKFGGPKGVGFLYVREGIHLEPLLSGGGQERGQRAGTENVAGIVGMAAALAESCAQIPKITAHLKSLRSCLIDRLTSAGIRFSVNGGSQVFPGIISLSFPGFEGEMLLHRLDLKGIQVATGSACDSVNTQVSHVLQEIGLPEDDALGTIRVSFGADNSPEDANTIADALCSICSNK